jgi:hypothetical protein
MPKIIKLLASFILLIPHAVTAGQVTLQSQWLGSPVTYTGLGLLTFSYEDTTIATDVHTLGITGMTATYVNAITAATFVFDNISFTLDAGVDSTIIIRSQVSSGSDASIFMHFRTPDDTQYSVSINFEDNRRIYPNTDLSNLIGELPDEEGTIVRPLVLPPGYSVSRYVLVQQTPLTLVPIPSSAWLFGSSLISLLESSRRRRYGNQTGKSRLAPLHAQTLLRNGYANSAFMQTIKHRIKYETKAV